MPYDFREPEAVLSRNALWFCLSRHERRYYKPEVARIRETGHGALDLAGITLATASLPGQRAPYLYPAETWNLNMLWTSMRRDGGDGGGGGSAAKDRVADCSRSAFGGRESFVRAFTAAATAPHCNN
jgi:hypothetical protein